MNENLSNILNDVKVGLQEIYQKRLKGLVLYGSRARGDAAPDSDVDVALIIDSFSDISKEIENTGDLVSQVSLDNNLVISLHPIRENDWLNRRTPLILNIKKEGITF